MGELFRSQDMTYVQLSMTTDAARPTIEALGRFGYFHMVDLSNPERPTKEFVRFKRDLAECVYYDRKLSALADLMKEYKIEMHDPAISEEKVLHPLEELKGILDRLEGDLERQTKFIEQNNREISSSKEHVAVLEAYDKFDIKLRAQEMVSRQRRDSQTALLDDADHKAMSVELKSSSHGAAAEDFNLRKMITGTIPATGQDFFRRMLYRITRGNLLAGFVPLPEPLAHPTTDQLVEKLFFYVMVLGDITEQRVKKMCQLSGCKLYELPDDKKQMDDLIKSTKSDITLKTQLSANTRADIVRTLKEIALKDMVSPLRTWQHWVAKEKAIYRGYMKCIFYEKSTTMEGWVPSKRLDTFRDAVRTAELHGAPPASIQEHPAGSYAAAGTPPTLFPTSPFTATFQGIVDTYGVPRYKEVNPGLFTVVTFPFLFGVMYGDIGHGTLLTIGGFLMLYFERSLLKADKEGKLGDIGTMAFGGRYAIFLMGLFALYNGWIYNDCFSIPIHAHKSHWYLQNAQDVDFVFDKEGVYPFGIDHAWYHTSNELVFFNSVKMKLAVILGVTQMTAGLFLSLANHIYFKDYAAVWFEFLPRFLFLTCTFGYMISIIFYKWSVDWSLPNAGSPPSLIQTMIAMFLSPGKVAAEDQLYTGQSGFQLFLVIVAIISVPVMLCCKPCMNKRKYAKKVTHHVETPVAPAPTQGREPIDEADFRTDEPSHARDVEHADEKHVDHKAHAHGGGGGGGGHGHGGEYEFSDDLIHNAIHTIEFVLGAVSNTASYLRLWALSLAHAQLASVFWDKIMQEYGFESGSINAVIGFAGWFGATFGVLLCMDTLECFLHALRLHWVEFQGKFFYADGYHFRAFNFEETADEL